MFRIGSLLMGGSNVFHVEDILGDPGVDSGGEGKSKQAEKYGKKEK